MDIRGGFYFVQGSRSSFVLKSGPVRIRINWDRFATQPSHWLDRAGKPNWLPLNSGYHDVMCTSPIWPVRITSWHSKVMESILACQSVLSTEWLALVEISCELWRISTGPNLWKKSQPISLHNLLQALFVPASVFAFQRNPHMKKWQGEKKKKRILQKLTIEVLREECLCL